MDVFISYSRTQSIFAAELSAALKQKDLSCWVDQSSIGPGQRWRSALREGILQASNFVVLLEREWIGSRECQRECQLASEYDKALIPIIVEKVSPSEWKKLNLQVSKEIESRNYIWTHGHQFSAIVEEVVRAVRTDYDWKSLHARLEQRSERWISNGESFGLLRGKELLRVLELINQATGKDPQISVAVASFIQASQSEQQRELEEQKERARHAESRSIAAAAAEVLTEDPIKSLDLAGQAWQKAPSIDALKKLALWYETYPNLVGMWPMKFPISSVDIDEVGQRFAYSEFIDALIIGDSPQQELRVQDLRNLGKIGSLTDPEGFGGCVGTAGKLFTIRRGSILSYRYDPFKAKLRQSTAGENVTTDTASMVVNLEQSLIALPDKSNSLAVYNISADRCFRFKTEGVCFDVAWIDETSLMVAEGGGLNRRSVEDWDVVVPLIPDSEGIISVDTRNGEWVALSCRDQVRLYRSEFESYRTIELHNVPDPATGVRFGQERTAFVFGGGGAITHLGLCEVDLESGQLWCTWLGGFQQAVTAFDPGQGKFLLAGRNDGQVYLWNRESLALATEPTQTQSADKQVEAVFSQTGDFSFLLEVWIDGIKETVGKLVSNREYQILTGSAPAVVKDTLLCVGCDVSLHWYQLGEKNPELAAIGKAHSNPIQQLATSPINSLWVSMAQSYRDNSFLELFVWDIRSTQPVLKLSLPRFNCTRMSFDGSGQILNLLSGETVVRSLLMDPDRWIERGQQMRALNWS